MRDTCSRDPVPPAPGSSRIRSFDIESRPSSPRRNCRRASNRACPTSVHIEGRPFLRDRTSDTEDYQPSLAPRFRLTKSIPIFLFAPCDLWVVWILGRYIRNKCAIERGDLLTVYALHRPTTSSFNHLECRVSLATFTIRVLTRGGIRNLEAFSVRYEIISGHMFLSTLPLIPLQDRTCTDGTPCIPGKNGEAGNGGTSPLHVGLPCIPLGLPRLQSS